MIKPIAYKNAQFALSQITNAHNRLIIDKLLEEGYFELITYSYPHTVVYRWKGKEYNKPGENEYRAKEDDAELDRSAGFTPSSGGGDREAQRREDTIRSDGLW